MYQYQIKVGKQLGQQLARTAKDKNMTIENFIEEILNRYFVPLHTIDQEAMAEGYKDMAEINLELSK